MRISGLSHANGIFFIGPTQIAEVDGSVIKKPVKKSTWWQLRLLIKAWRSLSIPVQLAIAFPTGALLGAAVWYQEWFWLHAALLYLASFHFWFPVQLKRYHGAEHMAFTIRRQKLEKESWMEADIRNAGCSTAAAVTGCFFLMGMLPFHGFDFHGVIITAAALSAAFITEVLRRRFPERLALITRLSGRLQQACTTARPDRLMVSLAVQSLDELIKHEKTPVSVKTR